MKGVVIFSIIAATIIAITLVFFAFECSFGIFSLLGTCVITIFLTVIFVGAYIGGLTS